MSTSDTNSYLERICTLEANVLLLHELHEAVLGSYEVTKQMNAADITSAINTSMTRRKSSALRCSCLFKQDEDDLEIFAKGAYYLVESRQNTVDVVLVRNDGSFACTHPSFANMGKPLMRRFFTASL